MTHQSLRKWRTGPRLLAPLLVAATFAVMGAMPPAATTTSPQDPSSQVQPAVAWSRDDAAHLLRRAGFSGTPEQINRLHALGLSGAVEYLLSGSLPAGVASANAPFPPAQLEPLHLPPAAEAKANVVQKRRGGLELRDQWVQRMVRTDRPLQEKMTLFWHGLFTSGIREVKSPEQMLAQNQLFHENALGNYRALTLAILHDPAMLKFLNNNENVKGKPNENLARELCELFTMGEGNGYTEKDVGEIARALTGATVRGSLKNPQGQYDFRPFMHDPGAKTIFGKTGNYKPDDVVDLIFQQPQPAEHLARRLWEFFAAPDPTDSQLAPVVAALRAHEYEVAPALRALFTSPDFYSEHAKFALIKSPTELLVSTVRMLDLPFEAPGLQRAASSLVGTMGQTLFEPPNVRGWPGGDNWITAATLFSRYNTATALVNDNLRPESPNGPLAQLLRKVRPAGDPPPGPHAASARSLFPNLPAQPTADLVVTAAVDRFLQRPLHPEKRKVLADVLGEQPLRLGDRSTDDRIRQMLGLLLSTPEYQVE